MHPRGIGDLIAHGEVLSDDPPVAFMRLRVPATLVDAVTASPKRVKTISFEISNLEIEATVHRFMLDPVTKAQTLTNMVFHPGDPWLTGYAQVGTDVDFMMGLCEIVHWRNDATGTTPCEMYLPTSNASPAITQQICSTGLLPDDDLPVLKYNGDPAG